MTRRLYLDDGPGEARGVVTLGGLPERLLIRRVTDRSEHHTGARLIGRIGRLDRALATAFIDLGEEPHGVLSLTGDAARLPEGDRIEVEVTAPARRDKGPVLRLIGAGEGEPRLLTPAPPIEAQLTGFAPGAVVVRGADARTIADMAEDAALAIEHPLPSGGRISIEPTRALVAIDVDVGSAQGDARRAASRANREALDAAARLLRLKGLGGPVVFDLAGKGHDGEALKKAAGAAFAPDQPGVAFGPITRFGLWPITLPRRTAPVSEQLCRLDGAPTPETLALRLLRAIEDEAGSGQAVTARAAPEVIAIALLLAPRLVDRIGPRFHMEGDPSLPRAQFDVHAV